jgi:hypothetical protein
MSERETEVELPWAKGTRGERGRGEGYTDGGAPSLGRNTLVGVAPQRARGDALQPTPRFHFLGAE